MTLKGQKQKKWDRESLTAEEIDLLIDTCESIHEEVIITTLADTGIRKNELVNMREAWCRFDKGKYGQMIIPVRPDYRELSPEARKNVKGDFVARGPKTKFERRVALTRRLSELLQRFFGTHTCVGINGVNIWKFVVALGKTAGLEKRVTPHVFRHSWVTNAYDAGVAKERIARRVGHIDSHMVETVYLHLNDEETDGELEAGGMLDV